MGENNKRKRLGRVEAPAGRGKSLPEARPIPIDDERFRWSAQSIDHEYAGEWDWHLAPKEAKDILDLLAQMSGLSWREVKAQTFNSKNKTRRLHHSQSIETICPAAQKRLEELEIAVSEVFRLRHGNLNRSWGYMIGPVFHVVWWDRHHRVCPVDS
ncbi:hypothetical protein [Nocardia sp. BMG111209]|uniref:hypothetical protein n=1 Tax=Nocardia sp. BMG111209 TaxID=1160137 RepID=UPI0012DD12D0|nr:hypothetical protein [Nocardia sp. BMG111209]